MMLIETFIALSGISLIITLHELGHYLTALATGTKIRSFSLGFGPVIASYSDSRGTVWKLSLLPIGGYVEMEELIVKSDSNKSATISGIKLILIALSGPVVNLALAMLLFTIVFASAGDFVNSNAVNEVFNSTNKGIIAPGDVIKAINNSTVDNALEVTQILDTISQSAIDKSTVDIRILRNGREKVITAKLNSNNKLGITFKTIWSGNKPGWIKALSLAWKQFTIYISSFFNGIRMIFAKKSSVQIVSVVSIFSDMFTHMNSKWNFVYYVGFISLSLGMYNLLPFPPLDGWNVLLGTAVSLSGRKIPSKPYQIMQIFGAVFAITLMSYSVLADFKRLLPSVFNIAF